MPFPLPWNPRQQVLICTALVSQREKTPCTIDQDLMGFKKYVLGPVGFYAILCLPNGSIHFALFILLCTKENTVFHIRGICFVISLCFRLHLTLSSPHSHSFISLFLSCFLPWAKLLRSLILIVFFFLSLVLTHPLFPFSFTGLLFSQWLVTLFAGWNPRLSVSAGLCDMSMCCVVPKGGSPCLPVN